MAFQKLLTSETFRDTMMSSKIARTSGEASASCTSGTVAGSPLDVDIGRRGCWPMMAAAAGRGEQSRAGAASALRSKFNLRHAATAGRRTVFMVALVAVNLPAIMPLHGACIITAVVCDGFA
jgi:hypothetical protein